MKKHLILSALALTLAACSKPAAPRPAEIKLYLTATYSYAVSPTESVVAARPGRLGTRFCYTDDKLAGVLVCNNLVTGTRTVLSGYDLGVVFTEPDAPTSTATAIRR